MPGNSQTGRQAAMQRDADHTTQPARKKNDEDDHVRFLALST
ncbi:hypothetical protein [Leclercia sp. W6]|nr:hypothetical protein [Leclercia sp. W6]